LKKSKKQVEKFKKVARELGCDNDKAAFEEKLKRIAEIKTQPKIKKTSAK